MAWDECTTESFRPKCWSHYWFAFAATLSAMTTAYHSLVALFSLFISLPLLPFHCITLGTCFGVHLAHSFRTSDLQTTVSSLSHHHHYLSSLVLSFLSDSPVLTHISSDFWTNIWNGIRALARGYLGSKWVMYALWHQSGFQRRGPSSY